MPAFQEYPTVQPLQILSAPNVPSGNVSYAFHQGNTMETGKSSSTGRVELKAIDPAKPFLFEIPDRVCTIRDGAYFNPDDPAIQYGGTMFDWTLVRDNRNPAKDFWPHYQRELDIARKDTAKPVVRFFQHEHITRRPIQLSPGRSLLIHAAPAQIRVGPFVRFTSHDRIVIWLESVTPVLIRARYRPSGQTAELSRYASTVRVGGRHFATIEIDGLQPGTFYDYTVALAPLPAVGPIPVESDEIKAVFPTLSAKVVASMKEQLAIASLQKSEWLTVRTLLPKYESTFSFATGSCRWYPGDHHGSMDAKALGPDMLDGLGAWMQTTPKAQWPQFLFCSGDQIYSDEMGDHHALMLTFGRFAERVPGPADPAAAPRDKLIDGAWAGRFAHRLQPFQYPGESLVKTVTSGITKINEIYSNNPDIQGIRRDYPGEDPARKLKERYETFRNKRQLGGAKGEAADEKKAREALQLLPTVDTLRTSVEPFRAYLPHWNAAFSLGYRGNPMGQKFLAHNFLLWALPEFLNQLPTLNVSGSFPVVRTPENFGHPSAEAGRHAADFAEYAYLYERSWTSSRNVRLLLAHLPTFLMFDDHELTDDWNFDVDWVRMLHNPKDPWQMWPKTLTDALAAYWVYQGWGNRAPSQWNPKDPRVAALNEARRTGTDALPALRRCLHTACFPLPPNSTTAPFQAGLSLDWHYQLPFDPPFLVPDCRSRKYMDPADDNIRVIDHDKPAATPRSQTIDQKQLDWIRGVLVDKWRGGPVAFLALSTPLLLPEKPMSFMLAPELAARSWAQGTDIAGIAAAISGSTALGFGSNALLRYFRRQKDLEHMIRDKSWRDLWGILDAMRLKGSPVKTLALVSGDVHHSYCMTGSLPGASGVKPEFLQITSSGFQTTIRGDLATKAASALTSKEFSVGKYRLFPGYLYKNSTSSRTPVLYENGVALVNVTLRAEPAFVVTHLSGANKFIFRYSSELSNKMRHEEFLSLANGTSPARIEAGLVSPFLGESAPSLFQSPFTAGISVAPAADEASAPLEPEWELESELESEHGFTGGDDRREVADTTIAPYRWICSVTFQNGSEVLDGGSGVLISDRHVLTAAHVVKDFASGPNSPTLWVYPGRSYGSEPFGSYTVSKVRAAPNGLDYALLTLSRPVDSKLLWWGHPSTATTWWSEALLPVNSIAHTAIPITTAGFPGDRDAQRRRMMEASGATAPPFTGQFRHTADTTHGQSGSPMWTERNGKLILLGIVVAYDSHPNQLALWVNLMRANIAQWMAADAPRPSKPVRRLAAEIPYRWVCRLEVYDNDLRRVVNYGTGLLISKRHVLTSASVIQKAAKDPRRFEVRVTPGYEFGKELHGTAIAAKARVPEAGAAYGLLTLRKTFAATLGNWGDAPYGISDATADVDGTGKSVHLAAFTRASGGGAGFHRLRVSQGAIVGRKENQLVHNAGLRLDAPGAPLWVEAGTRRLLVGVTTSVFAKGTDRNWSCYLGPDARVQLNEWMNADLDQKEFEAEDDFLNEELEYVDPEAEMEEDSFVVDPDSEFEDSDADEADAAEAETAFLSA